MMNDEYLNDKNSHSPRIRYKAILVNHPLLLQTQITQILNDLTIPTVGRTVSGEETIKIITQTKANIIILNMILQDSDAIQLATQYQSHRMKKFFLVISAIQSQKTINRSFDSGIFDFLPTPLNSERLAQSLLKMRQCIKLGDRHHD